VPGIGEQRHRSREKSEYCLDHDKGCIEPDPDRKGAAMALGRRAVVVVVMVAMSVTFAMPMIVAMVLILAVVMTVRMIVIVMMGVVAPLPLTHRELLQDQALHNCRSAARIVTATMHGFGKRKPNAIQLRM
jgi:hypothetical protein